MPSEKIEVASWLQALGKQGVPIFIVIWLFLVQMPKHERMLEERLDMVTGVYSKLREDQSKIIKDQSDNFRASLRETVNIVRQLEQSVRQMSSDIKTMSDEIRELKKQPIPNSRH